MFRFLLIIIGCLLSMSAVSEYTTADLKSVIKGDLWAISEGTHNDLPIMIRFRNKLDRNEHTDNHPQLIHVYWEYSEHESGMPTKIESSSMEIFENRLVDALESDLSGFLSAVITTNGYREWVYYTTSIDAFAERLHNMPQETDPYPIKIEADLDPEWDYFFNQVRPE